MVAIGLRKPYANMEVGDPCTCMMCIDSLMVVLNGIKISGIHFQNQILNNNQMKIEQ
jgi:hypothetical protein